MSSSDIISKNVTLISLRIIVGLLVASICAVVSMLVVRSKLVDFQASSVTSLAANEIFEDLFEAEIASLRWQVFQDDRGIAELQENYEELIKAQEALQNFENLSPDLADPKTRLGADIRSYGRQFQAVTNAG